MRQARSPPRLLKLLKSLKLTDALEQRLLRPC